jgi:hypothetical protein
MLKDNIYNTNREFDYATVRSIVLKSLDKIAKQEALKTRAYIHEDVIFDFKDNDYPNNVKLPATPHMSLTYS